MDPVSSYAEDEQPTPTDARAAAFAYYQAAAEGISGVPGPAEAANAAYDEPIAEIAKKKRKGAKVTLKSSLRSVAKGIQGTIEGLEDKDGTSDANEQYDLDPYGALENESQLNKEAKDNAIRFQGFAYDDSAALYDMQARHYRPEIGRFLSRDRYESSDLDFNLEADPLTNNLYAFAGGSPVNGVEWDGHILRRDFDGSCHDDGLQGPSVDDKYCKGKPRSSPWNGGLKTKDGSPGSPVAATPTGTSGGSGSGRSPASSFARGFGRAAKDTVTGLAKGMQQSCIPMGVPRTPAQAYRYCASQISALAHPRRMLKAAWQGFSSDISQGSTAESIGYGTFIALTFLAPGGAAVKGASSSGRAARVAGRGASALRLSAEAMNWLNAGPKNVYVYYGVRNGERVYVGITNDIVSRQRGHGSRFDLHPVPSDPLTRHQARAVEQVLIERNPRFENEINSINPNRPIYDDAYRWGESWLAANEP